MHHEEMMSEMDEDVAKIAIRTKTPLVWKREGNELTYTYCLTCKKVSLGDAKNFKKRHGEKLCKSGWATYQELFLSKVPIQEREMEAEPINEIVGSSEIPTDYSVCIDFFQRMNPDFRGTVEQGINSLLKDIVRHKEYAGNLEQQIRTLENQQMSIDQYRRDHKSMYESYETTIKQQCDQIRLIETESGVEEARQKYNQAGKELRETQAELRLAEERRGNRWTEIGAERDTAVKEVKELKFKIEEMKKEWKSEKKEMELEKKELQQELEDLEEKYKKLRRSQRDSD